MKVNLSPLTLIYFALCLLLSHELTLAATLSAILVHELTHLIALWLMGGHATTLTVTPLGLSLERCGLLSHRRELVLSLCAPLANLLMAALYYSLSLDACTVDANLGFGLLNLLPIYPLDGGKALSSLLEHLYEPERAKQICRSISYASLLFFWMLSVAVALMLGGNLSPLILSVGLFLATHQSSFSNK